MGTPYAPVEHHQGNLKLAAWCSKEADGPKSCALACSLIVPACPCPLRTWWLVLLAAAAAAAPAATLLSMLPLLLLPTDTIRTNG
jgi:hypothetical protein